MTTTGGQSRAGEEEHDRLERQTRRFAVSAIAFGLVVIAGFIYVLDLASGL